MDSQAGVATIAQQPEREILQVTTQPIGYTHAAAPIPAPVAQQTMQASAAQSPVLNTQPAFTPAEPPIAALEPLMTPPRPNPQMLAAASAYVQAPAEAAREAAAAPARQPAPVVAPLTSTSVNQENAELARARAIAQRLGITNLTDDEYDIPTYLRREQEREL